MQLKSKIARRGRPSLLHYAATSKETQRSRRKERLEVKYKMMRNFLKLVFDKHPQRTLRYPLRSLREKGVFIWIS